MSLCNLIYATNYPEGYTEQYETEKCTVRYGELIMVLDTDERKIVIPSEVDGNAVTAIGGIKANRVGDYSFIIPDTVQRIGNGAFLNFASEGSKILDILIPDSVEQIEDEAFKNCGMTAVTIPNSVQQIGIDAFWGNNLKEVTIPESVTNISTGAFSENRSLKKVTILSKNINTGTTFHGENDPFRATSSELEIYGYKDTWAEKIANTRGYTFVDIESINENPDDPENPYNPGGNEEPGADVIEYTSRGIVYRIDNINNVATVVGLTEEANGLEKYKEKLTIPGILEVNNKNIVVNTIGESAFKNVSLKLIELPNTVITIEKDAFNGVKELTGMILPANVVTIGERAFANCSELQYIYIPPTATQINLNMMENNNYIMVYGCNNSQAETYENSLEFESGFYAIDDTNGKGDCVVDGFIYRLNEGDSTATVVGAKDNITFIIYDNYKPVKVPTKITVNGKDYYVKTIAEHAIDIDCNDVIIENCEEIEVGYGVETIEKNAFTNYKNLKTVKVPKTVSNIDLKAFSGIGTNGYKVEISSKSQYYACEDFVLYNKNKSVLYGKLNTSISDFTVPESVEEIKSYTAKSITIGRNVTKIEKGGIKADEIRGYLNSYAHDYAYENSIPFVRIYEKGEFEFLKDNFNFTNSSEYFVDDSSVLDSQDIYRLVKYENILENSLIQEMKDRGAQEEGWVGSCAGMVISAELFKKGILTPEFWQVENKDAECTYEIEAPNVNESIRDLITFYQVFQNYIYQGEILEKTENIEKIYKCIKEYYSDKKSQYSTLELAYYYKKNGANGAHMVLVVGEPERLDDNFFKFHSLDLSDYSYRIPIYDPNKTEINYLYIDENFSVISNGDENSISDFKMNADEELGEDGKIYKVWVSKLNVAKVPNLEETIKEGGKIGKEGSFIYINGKLKSSITISNGEGEYVDIDGESLETKGNLNADVGVVIGDTVDENGVVEYYSVALDSGEKYYVETKNDTDELDISIQFGDSYMTAKTETGGKAIFENKRSVTLNNPTGKEYGVKLTLNDEFMTLPWYTIEATGRLATEVKLEMTTEGAIITADNLENITINANNSNENVRLNVSTKEDKILIKANSDGTKLMAYVDKDGDGIFETPLRVDEGRNLAVDAIDETEENVQTGDGIVFVVIAFWMAVVSMFCLNLKN